MGVFVVSTDWIIYRYTLIFKNGVFWIAVLFDGDFGMIKEGAEENKNEKRDG